MNHGMRLVEELLRQTGPGSYLLLGCDHADTARALIQRGCNVRIVPGDNTDFQHNFGGRVDSAMPPAEPRFDVVVAFQSMLEMMTDPDDMLIKLRLWVGRYLVLAPDIPFESNEPERQKQSYWVDAAIRSGYRRAPVAVNVAEHAAFNNPALPALTVLEKIEESSMVRGEMNWLLENRNLHMDMSREFGPRADAHMIRYALAAEWVRSGDTVLDCACGLGYGTAILAARSAAGKVIGVDIDAESIAYAQRQFGARYGIEYVAASGTDLRGLPDSSVDLIASFETIEHVEDYHELIAEFRRVLKPDGRIVASVPNLWVDETGRDPNPHHFHAFDWSKFRDAFTDGFIVEARYRQEAPGGFKLHDAERAISRCADLDSDEPDTEWWVLVASMDPTAKSATNFRHPQFASAHIDGEHVTDFGAYYQNPWLYRPMVQMGERIADDTSLADLALRVLQSFPMDSADTGAAITVLGYHIIAQHRFEQVEDWRNVAEAYIANSSTNPHVCRWQISIAFAAALMTRDVGLRDQSMADFDRVAHMDALAFSPLLMTKIIAARFWSGTMRLVNGDASGARQFYLAGIEAARKALQAPDVNAIGNPEAPLGFGFQELAEVADMASQCVAALNHINLYQRSPGLFWSRVEVRRFGLASWAKALERENQQLRQQLSDMRATQNVKPEIPEQPWYRRTA